MNAQPLPVLDPKPPVDRGARTAWTARERHLGWVLVALGTVLRLREYLFDRSLWRDEASLVWNLQHRGLLGFTTPLRFSQATPPCFWVVEHLLANGLGGSELAFRLLPLLAGVASLLVLQILVRRELDARTGLVALAVFAAGAGLIEYSNEVKQYTLDVLVAMLLVLATSVACRSGRTRRDLLVLASAGAVACWVSHTAIFVLVGCGLVLAWEPLRSRQRARIEPVAAVGATWMVSWGTFYLLLARRISDNAFFRQTLPGAFLPVPPHNQAGLHQWSTAWSSLVTLLTGHSALTPVVTLLMALGVVALWRQRRFDVLTVIAVPYGVAVLASAFDQYPAVERWLLFVTPGVAVLMAAGVVWLAAQLRARTPLLATAVLVVLPLAMMVGGFEMFRAPTTIEEMRPALAQMAAQVRPGDAAYATVVAEPAFDYYTARDHLHLDPVIIGQADVGDRHALVRELAPLRGRARVWVVTSAFWEPQGAITPALTAALDSMGHRLERFDEAGVSVYLYDLSSAGG